MSAAVPALPEDQLRALQKAYRQAVSAKRWQALLFAIIFTACMLLAAKVGEVDLARFVNGLPRFYSYFYDILPKLAFATLRADLAEWYWNLDGWLLLLLDTLLIAYVGTFIGALGGFFLCFLASANLTRNRYVRVLARRFLEFFRTVPEIVFALVFVFAFGLGPVPGVLAIAIHTAGALGKLYAEVVENIDMKPVEGATASGASWVQMVRFAVIPQVLQNFVSYTLLRFEINFRGASVLGFVGAGGIGKELLSSIRQFYYADVSAILLLIVVTVFVIDSLTERLRHALIGVEVRP
jgi:phosphonate transport system permease protein